MNEPKPLPPHFQRKVEIMISILYLVEKAEKRGWLVCSTKMTDKGRAKARAVIPTIDLTPGSTDSIILHSAFALMIPPKHHETALLLMKAAHEEEQ